MPLKYALTAPKVPISDELRKPCKAATLPTDRKLTRADLETGYIVRGYDIAECDEMRSVAIQALDAQQKLDAQVEALRLAHERPWYLKWMP